MDDEVIHILPLVRKWVPCGDFGVWNQVLNKMDMDDMTTATTTPCTRCLLEKLQEDITGGQNEIQAIQIMKILYNQRQTDGTLALYLTKNLSQLWQKRQSKVWEGGTTQSSRTLIKYTNCSKDSPKIWRSWTDPCYPASWKSGACSLGYYLALCGH